jgi:hypothetical protein
MTSFRTPGLAGAQPAVIKGSRGGSRVIPIASDFDGREPAKCGVHPSIRKTVQVTDHKGLPATKPNVSLIGRSRPESTTDSKRKGDCMSRFQQGSLFKLERKSVPNVWVFRWYETTLEKRTYKKQIVGSVTKLRNRREAEKTVSALRSSINAEVGTPKTVCDLAAHYRLHELTRERKAFSTIDNHRLLFKRYIEPRWGIVGSVRFVPWRSRNGCTLFH